ncbi:putative inactive purple acid phosphatase 27 [Forsythia ovata]|uniref:Inactive purple acid phosphatase 27 n=1 Tax=Forsythia ovata TaxID=205694 RepID=A0ABD1QQA7_9LAMI
MEIFRVLRIFLVFTIFFLMGDPYCSVSSSLPERLVKSRAAHHNYTAISEFRLLNRKTLEYCPDPNPYLQITTSSTAKLFDEEYITVNIAGVLLPSTHHWVAMISPSHSSVAACLENAILYAQTGDTASLPLLCHYPVKAQYVSNDTDYLSCKKKECKEKVNGICVLSTCGASLSFHVINIRTDIEFVLFSGGFVTPCILRRSQPLTFANPNKPLYGHLSSTDSTANSMRVTWVSGNQQPQNVQYGNGKSATSLVSTFSQTDMCNTFYLQSPAKDFGWHDPGYIHSAVMTGLNPSTKYSYRYGSPVASKVSYMTAIGNHERDYKSSGSFYSTPDSGGECGIPYETYFPMPAVAKDKPWYSIEQGSVHFTVISTEHIWTPNSEQYTWMKKDMAAVDRSRTPWLIFTGHRPMYTSSGGNIVQPNVDYTFVHSVEPLLLANKVDLVLFGHVHNYERTCAVYKRQCKAMPKKDENGIDTYDNTNYSAPVHAVIGMAGFSLDGFSPIANAWSLIRISKYGYTKMHAMKKELKVEFVNADTRKAEDSFRITKS